MRSSGLNFKQTAISGSKKSVVIQHNAGKLFRQWGEVNIYKYLYISQVLTIIVYILINYLVYIVYRFKVNKTCRFQ